MLTENPCCSGKQRFLAFGLPLLVGNTVLFALNLYKWSGLCTLALIGRTDADDRYRLNFHKPLISCATNHVSFLIQVSDNTLECDKSGGCARITNTESYS
jgi:hypothetical protein